MKSFSEKLRSGIESLELDIHQTQEQTLLRYVQMLEKWNKAFNLTAVRSIDDMVSLHLLDCLAIVPHIQADRLLDVGTGAGLPGIVLAICFPDVQVTLLDGNGKKIRFCRQVAMDLKLDNVIPVHSRIEQFQSENIFKQITSRAFTSLENMVSLLEKHLLPPTQLLAMKGALPSAEITQLLKRGFRVHSTALEVPYVNAERHVLKISLDETQ